MLSLYAFCLVLGGGFLAVSLFGDAFDTDFGDVDTDLDADLASDLGGDLETDAGGWARILSIRSLIYAVFGFGAVGTGLHIIWGGEQPGVTAAFAGIGGVASGALISVLFSFVKRTESGDRPSEDRYSGLLGVVSLPITDEGGGQIVVTQSDRTFRLPARIHSSVSDRSGSSEWSEVMVIAMEKGVAFVAPAGPELLEAPDNSGEEEDG